mgnify:CR=1 FL=1
MLRAEAVQDDTLAAIQTALGQFPDEVQEYARKKVRPFVSHLVDKLLRIDPGPVVYADNGKLRWKSERQRRYVLGYVLDRDSQGNVIPYRRTGAARRGWQVRGDYAEGFAGISVANTRQAAQYIYGSATEVRPQQPFHEDTGWPALVQMLQAIRLDAEAFVEDGLSSLLPELIEKAGG